MRPKVHAGRVEPHKKGLVFFRSALNELLRAVQKLEVDGFHAFFVERTGIGHAAVRKTVHHTARPEVLAEGWVPRVVGVLGLFFCVQVIKIAKEFIKAVLKNPAAKEAALAKLLKDMKLEKAKKPEKVWKAFESEEISLRNARLQNQKIEDEIDDLMQQKLEQLESAQK